MMVQSSHGTQRFTPHKQCTHTCRVIKQYNGAVQCVVGWAYTHPGSRAVTPTCPPRQQGRHPGLASERSHLHAQQQHVSGLGLCNCCLITMHQMEALKRSSVNGSKQTESQISHGAEDSLNKKLCTYTKSHQAARCCSEFNIGG